MGLRFFRQTVTSFKISHAFQKANKRNCTCDLTCCLSSLPHPGENVLRPAHQTIWAQRVRGFAPTPPGLATNSILLCFLFVKNHWFTWRANQWPLIGETLFSSVPPSNSLVSISDPWRTFWADTCVLQGPWTRLVSCFRDYRKTRTPSGSKVPGHCQKQPTQT